MFKFCLGCYRIVGGIRWREGQKEQCVLIGIFDKPSCTVRQRHFNVYPFRSTLFFLPHMFLSNSTFRVLYLLISISLRQRRMQRAVHHFTLFPFNIIDFPP